MRRSKLKTWIPGMLGASLLIVGAAGCQSDDAAEPDARAADAGRIALMAQGRAIFGELPDEAASETNPVTESKIVLGRMLYFDARLSKNHDVSCNSCHDLATFGQDNQPNSPGHKGQRGGRSSPTVYNAAIHISQFWDGRAADVEEQAKGPVLNPIEMAMPDEASVVQVLHSIPGYQAPFAAAFPGESDPITYDNMARAIGAFERRLMTPGPFDDFLGGNATALSDKQVAGMETFIQTGCVTCHMGPALGGGMYQKLGLLQPYETQDQGRFDLTGVETDRYVFKVPSLRNIAQTAPYFHDGSLERLSETIRIMARHQLGKELSDSEVRSIEAFLGSLTGRVDPVYTRAPELPASGSETPAPDPT
jgi:cytochrome c peroxidase